MYEAKQPMYGKGGVLYEVKRSNFGATVANVWGEGANVCGEGANVWDKTANLWRKGVM